MMFNKMCVYIYIYINTENIYINTEKKRHDRRENEGTSLTTHPFDSI